MLIARQNIVQIGFRKQRKTFSPDSEALGALSSE